MSHVIIADPHNLCREALCNYIKHADQSLRLQDVGDCSSLTDCMADTRADLILVDRDLPGWDRGSVNGVKIAMIVAMADERLMTDPSLHGIFPKSLSCKAFLGGIHEILAGGTFFPPEEDSSARDFIAAKKLPQDFSLTTREKEVLSYLVKGQSNKDIARALNLQVVTVKLHVRGICRKMKVANRTQAALTAKENGWG